LDNFTLASVIEADDDTPVVVCSSQFNILAVRQLVLHQLFILSLYSGVRRNGGMDKFAAIISGLANISVHVICIDVISGNDLHDVFISDNARMILDLIDKGKAQASTQGPPCETWARVRFRVIADRPRAPRPVRAIDHLWGRPDCKIREHDQVNVGNRLLHFALEVFYALARAGGASILEHPADPGPALPAIWKLEANQRMMSLPCAQHVRMLQGPLGQVSPKPTHLMALRTPGLRAILSAMACCTADKPALPIYDDTGAFATAQTKTYPPRMCASMVLSIWLSFAKIVSPAEDIDTYLTQAIQRCVKYCDTLNDDMEVAPLPKLPASADTALLDLASWPSTDNHIGPDYNAHARS